MFCVCTAVASRENTPGCTPLPPRSLCTPEVNPELGCQCTVQGEIYQLMWLKEERRTLVEGTSTAKTQPALGSAFIFSTVGLGRLLHCLLLKTMIPVACALMSARPCLVKPEMTRHLCLLVFHLSSDGFALQNAAQSLDSCDIMLKLKWPVSPVSSFSVSGHVITAPEPRLKNEHNLISLDPFSRHLLLDEENVRTAQKEVSRQKACAKTAEILQNQSEGFLALWASHVVLFRTACLSAAVAV